MIPDDFKIDFMNLKEPEQWEALKKKYENYEIKLSEFDEDMRIHFNKILKKLVERKGYKSDPDVHVDIQKRKSKI